MRRKHLGGGSRLKANHSSEKYNDTLESVFDSAMANLDSKHKSKRHKRRKLPNLLSLCFKSAAGDVMTTSTASASASASASTITTAAPVVSVRVAKQCASTSNNKNVQSLSTPSSSSPSETALHVNDDDDDDAIFILNDGTMGQKGHYRPIDLSNGGLYEALFVE